MKQWMITLIGLIIGVVSPEIKAGVAQLLDNLEQQAKKTTNPWDDMLVALLRNVITGK